MVVNQKCLLVQSAMRTSSNTSARKFYIARPWFLTEKQLIINNYSTTHLNDELKMDNGQSFN